MKKRWRSSAAVVGVAVVALGSVVAMMSARDAQADAPPCRYAISINTVEDKETTLTWQRASDDLGYSWAAANMYCDALTLDGKAWRLPTVYELQSIVDESQENPAIDAAAFPKTFETYFWSSVHSAGPFDFAWAVDFYDGRVLRAGVEGEARVRCVVR